MTCLVIWYALALAALGVDASGASEIRLNDLLFYLLMGPLLFAILIAVLIGVVPRQMITAAWGRVPNPVLWRREPGHGR